MKITKKGRVFALVVFGLNLVMATILISKYPFYFGIALLLVIYGVWNAFYNKNPRPETYV
jgi:hypothetical protein